MYKYNKLDLLLLHEEERTCYIIDVACPLDKRVDKMEKQEFERYIELKYEHLKVWNSKEMNAYIVYKIPIAIGTLGINKKQNAKCF